MRLLFAVYHLATTHQALRRMPTMAKLAIQWNFRDKDGVREDLGRAYVGPDGARVFLFCIADVLLGYINELARKSPVIGIAIDESTDPSGKKVLLIYVRLRCADGVFRTFYWAALYVKQLRSRRRRCSNLGDNTAAALNRGKEGRGKEGGNIEENGIEPRSLLAQFLGL